jgi:hypothetical protein
MQREPAENPNQNPPEASAPINEPTPRAESATPIISADEALETLLGLEQLDWSAGLNREQMRRRYRALPEAIYLRLPTTKKFYSAEDVLREAGISASRAEGEFLGPNPELPALDAIEDGGPPAWGPQPGVYGEHAANEAGSAEDTRGLELGTEEQSE